MRILSHNIKNRFLERGYKPSLIENSLVEVRDEKMKQKANNISDENVMITPFITNYYKGAEQLKSIINKNWFI